MVAKKRYLVHLLCKQWTDPTKTQADLIEVCDQKLTTIDMSNLAPGLNIEVQES
jgi:hypothetical protein